MKLFSLEAIATSNSVGSLFFGVLIIFVAAVGTYHSSEIFLGLGFLTVLGCGVLFSAPKKTNKKRRIEPSLDLDQEAGLDHRGYRIKEAAIDLVQKVGRRLTRAHRRSLRPHSHTSPNLPGRFRFQRFVLLQYLVPSIKNPAKSRVT